MSTSARPLALVVLASVALAACVGAPSSGPVSSGSCAPSASACASPSSTATGSGGPAGFACPPGTTVSLAPTNRLTGVTVTARTGYAEVAFSFGMSAPGSGSAPGVIVEPAVPPFVQGASGLPLAVDGDRFVELVFRDMVVADEAGSPTYAGPQTLRPGTPAVTAVVQAEAFEGVVRWIVGMPARSCVRVTVDRVGGRILVDVTAP